MVPPRYAALIALLSCAVVAFACKSNSDHNKTPSVSAGGTATAIAASSGTPPIDAGAIRRLDLQVSPGVQALLRATSGEYVSQAVVYVDLTADGVDEAVVPIASGGTQGDAAFIVLTPDGAGGATTLLSVTPHGSGGMSVAVQGGNVVETEPKPGPDDPECCPSQLHVTTYAWDGSTLAVQSTVDVPNPSGGGKTTPPSGAAR